MLVLSRKIRETVVIYCKLTGEEIGRVNVTAIKGDKVRLGFDFPDWIGIDRNELKKKKDDGPV